MDDEVPGQGDARREAMTGSTDPRAVRTREKLVDAFHEAIQESDPRQMSVSALARAAGVNRTSFYEHFASPEDLAIHALSELFEVVSNADIALRSGHSVSGAEASRRALREIVAFVGERRGPYARLLGPGAAPQLVRAVAGAFTERTVLALEPMDVRPAEADPRVTAQFLAGGVLGVIGAWLADPDPVQGPDELVEALIQCLPGWLLDG
ncbi:MAG TPA: TetR/AcrR family transcriptional regulator [Streptosporangiaceae bacterium]|jgi:AcrR family transcriptional regulator|nr:TetR/AcrR family transcriptional regulator [Streptosporangiaceae bacterium]